MIVLIIRKLLRNRAIHYTEISDETLPGIKLEGLSNFNHALAESS
jgi:hypothetical protein